MTRLRGIMGGIDCWGRSRRDGREFSYPCGNHAIYIPLNTVRCCQDAKQGLYLIRRYKNQGTYAPTIFCL